MSDMNIYTKRLHSFRPKRRPSTSNSKLAPPPTRWPHDRPSAKTLAAAGLYYNPSEHHPDNVTCYLCAKDLDGWESDDDPRAEHVKHCPDCGWAQVSVVSASVSVAAEDPRGARMVRARADTFGDWWPHEGKLGWTPSVQRMAEAGWHYAPTKDSDDFASCAYCGLSLDGWEPTDDPVEEHQRRTSHCAFFTWTPPPRQPTRKTSRASMQSVLANSDDELVMKPNKRARKPKKAAEPEPEPEPVDNVFEDAPRGRKRTSTAAQQGPIVMYDGTLSTEEEAGHEQQQQPAQKKRATRASLAAQQLSRDAKMGADSDNESIASIASRAGAGAKAKGKAKKPAARRNSRARGNSVTRKPKKAQPIAIPSDDEIDRALALDLERPLTDEEEGFKDFKQPFIRPMKRVTRSRASLAVEEKMRNAPPDTILNTVKKRGRSRTPTTVMERSPTKSPSKRFFRESEQDFSFPVRVPKHLAVEDDPAESRRRNRNDDDDDDGFAGDTINVAARDTVTDTEMEMEIKVKAKKAPPKKAPRGRKKKDAAETVTATTEDEPEALPPPPPPPKQPKRGKAAKKAAASTRESNVTVDSVQEKIELQLYQEQEQEEQRPQKSSRRRLVRGARPKRESVISIASTAEPDPAQGSSFMDIDHHQHEEEEEEEPAEASDAGSVIRHDVADTLYPTLPPSPGPRPQEAEAEAEAEAEMEEAEPTPKPTKKPAAPIIITKRPTRSSAVSTASTTVSSIAGSHLNSDSDNTPRQKGRKPTKKEQARQLRKTKAKAKDDALKKGSESFFSSAQNEEMKGRKGRRTRSSMTAAEAAAEAAEEEEEGQEASAAQGSPVAAAGNDVHMAEAAEEHAASDDNDDLSATDIDPRSSASSPAPGTEASSTERPLTPPHPHQHAPAPAPTPARMPLSPVRRGMNIPLTTTTPSNNKAHANKATTAAQPPHSRRPWVPVDLDTVFAHGGSEESDEGGAGALTARERDMTVAEWVKWNAVQAEARMKAEGERIVALFEACGGRAREAVEAMETVD